MVSKILVFALIVGTASAAVWLIKLPEKPKELAHKEGCYIEEINDVIPVNAVVTLSGKCMRIQCAANHMTYDSCYPINEFYCYQTTEDLSKPYPDCCPKISCFKKHDLY